MSKGVLDGVGRQDAAVDAFASLFHIIIKSRDDKKIPLPTMRTHNLC